MKKIYAFLLIMAMWHPAYGLDAFDHIMSYFTDDPKYTIDKRKYVSRDIEPFSAVVGLKYANGKNWCSGTLTADGIVVTAKHCIYDGDTGYKQLGALYINHKDAGDVGVKEQISSTGSISDPYGNYDPTTAVKSDWAFLLPKQNISSNINLKEDFLKSKMTFRDKYINMNSIAINAGYGALKILSDQEIHTLRTEYVKWLSDIPPHLLSAKNKELDASNILGSLFVSYVRNGDINVISPNTFRDTHRLKASVCYANSGIYDVNLYRCSLYGGNSGGPIFINIGNTWYLYGAVIAAYGRISTNSLTYIQGAFFVPTDMFLYEYDKLVSKLKGNKNEK